jgi:hypothetical protein
MNRLAAFWRQRSKRGRTLLVAGAAVAALAIVGAVIGSADDEATVTTTTTGTDVLAGRAITCLEDAGLSSVEEREVDTWHGFHEGPSYAIIVHKLPKTAKAPTVVAGTYAVTGRFKVAAEGEGLTTDEGLWADALVQEVAACLGG